MSTVGAIALFFAGLRRVGPTAASILSTLEPVVTVGAGVRRVRRVARSGAARRRSAGALGGARCPRAGAPPRLPTEGEQPHDADRSTARSRSWRARRAAPGAARRWRSARRARPCTAPAAAPRERRSEYDRPETIEETAELVTAAGGTGIAVAVDHLEAGRGRGARAADRRRARAARRAGQRHLGRRAAVRVGHAGLGARPREGAAAAAPGRRHAPDHQPLRAAAADPPARRAGRGDDRRHARVQRRALPGLRVLRPGQDRRSSGSPSRRARSSRRTAAPPWR